MMAFASKVFLNLGSVDIHRYSLLISRPLLVSKRGLVIEGRKILAAIILSSSTQSLNHLLTRRHSMKVCLLDKVHFSPVSPHCEVGLPHSMPADKIPGDPANGVDFPLIVQATSLRCLVDQINPSLPSRQPLLLTAASGNWILCRQTSLTDHSPEPPLTDGRLRSLSASLPP
jgi:hypothetical protein